MPAAMMSETVWPAAEMESKAARRVCTHLGSAHDAEDGFGGDAECAFASR